MSNKEFIEMAYEFLLKELSKQKLFSLCDLDENKKREITKKIINEHLKAPSKVKSINDVTKRFIISAQNAHMKPKVIGAVIFDIENNEDFERLMCSFNPCEILEKYDESWENVFDAISKAFDGDKHYMFNSQNQKSSIWKQFSNSIITIAKYTKSIQNTCTFYQEIDKKGQSIISEISKEISGMGVVLVQDALKELGCSQFGKPDVHINDIFAVFFKLEKKEITNEQINDLFQKLLDNSNGLDYIDSIYAIDKLFWLIGSGNFYKYNFNIGSHKRKFINMLKKS